MSKSFGEKHLVRLCVHSDDPHNRAVVQEHLKCRNSSAIGPHKHKPLNLGLRLGDVFGAHMRHCGRDGGSEVSWKCDCFTRKNSTGGVLN